MKKQYISFLLLFLLIAPAVVSYTWLQHRKAVVRKEVKWKMIAGIDTHELVHFSFTRKEAQTQLNWEHAKEFEYKGEMYDVVKKVCTNDTIQYWCWWDHEETKLSKQLTKLLVGAYQKDAPTKDHQKQIIQFYTSLFFHEITDWKLFEYSTTLQSVVFYKSNYSAIMISIAAPPPELI